MWKISTVFASLTLSLFLAQTPKAHAQSLAPYEVKPDGSQASITLDSKSRDIKELSVYFVSTGNVSTAVAIELTGPVGLKVSARSGFKGNAASANVLADTKRMQVSNIRGAAKKELAEYALPAGSSSYANYGSASIWYHLQKDACTGNKSSQYVTQVKLDLSGVAANLYDQGFTIAISLKEYKFSGAKVASIKPSSDGMYRGEPILLMGSVSYGNEYVNIVSWKKNRISGRKRIPVVKYVGYKGYGLSLARLKGSLTGGKRTFELSNGGDIYGVCFKATRTRQSANGYPAPR